MKNQKRLPYAVLNIGLFVSAIASLGVLFFVLPAVKISEYEKRDLAQLPVFRKDSLFKGSYTRDLDLFVADQFPYREKFVAWSFWMAHHRGLHDEKVAFYTADALKKPEANHNVPGKIDSTLQDSIVMNDTTASGDGGDIVSNMLIYNGMAIQFFGGNSTMAKAYAGVINKYQQALAGKATVYDVVVPSTADLYLPEEYRRQSASEKKNIETIYANLDPGIKSVDAYTPMMEHKNEYLFFNTDHHWTGTGAYYAYSAFCSTAGIAPVQFSQMERKVKKNWLGSLYLLCRDERLKANPDSAVYYKVRGNYKAYRYTDEAIDKPIKTTLYAEYGAGYGVYLGGDFPLMKIETENKTGRSVVIVKNSFGNAFSTYFVANFDNVYIVDYRYFNHSLVDLVINNGITDVVFLNNSFSANTSWHIHRIDKLLHGASSSKVKATDPAGMKDPADTMRKRKNDSLNAKKN